MHEKERLSRIWELVDKKEHINRVIDALKRECPESFGNLEYYHYLQGEISRINDRLTDLGFYRRVKR